jgi:hypothetical protein
VQKFVYILKNYLPSDVKAAMQIDHTYLDTETRMQENALQLVYLESHLLDSKVECPSEDGWNNKYGLRCLKTHVLNEAQ